MAKLKESLDRVFTVDRELNAVVATMTDPAIFHRFVLDLESCQRVDNTTYRFIPREKTERDVNQLLARTIVPIVVRKLSRGMSGYLDRVMIHRES